MNRSRGGAKVTRIPRNQMSLKLWNDLNLDIRDADTLTSFKTKIKEIFKPQVVPSYFITGDRCEQMYHARIINDCSNLNADLHSNHLKDTPECNFSGSEFENAEHFFFQCQHFTNQIYVLFTNTRRFHPLNTNKLLYVIENLSDEENTLIFK